MADVNVNIRGRDDGLGSQLDGLREKAESLGTSLRNIDIDNLTPTQQKVAVSDLAQNTLRDQQTQVRLEYSGMRSANSQEFAEMRGKAESGEISKGAFARYEKEFKFNQEGLSDQESQELLQLEKEMNESLREILKEMSTDRKIEQEIRQRDNKEFRGSGVAGGILSENEQLRKEQRGAKTPEEVAAIQAKIDANNEKIAELRRPGGGVDSRGALMTMGALGTGDLMGTIQGGLQFGGDAVGGMGGKMAGLAKGLTITGLIAGLAKEVAGFADQLRSSYSPVAAMRGGYLTGQDAMSAALGTQGMFTQSPYDIGALGLRNVDFAGMMADKARTSGISGPDLMGRTYEDLSFEKAFGASVGIFSEFERFTQGQEDATKIGLDVLNVLTSIDKSTLTATDLTTLTEKLASAQTIMSIQRQQQDSVNVGESLELLAMLERAGLSGKGERGASFIQNLSQGLGEGGGDNLMLLKLEAARRANPELAGSPAKLRRKVRFDNLDPEYVREMFDLMRQVSGGSQMAMDNMIYSMFNPQSEYEMEMYKRIGSGEDIDIQKMRQRKATLDRDTMIKDAESGTGASVEAINDFTSTIQSWISGWAKFAEGDAIRTVNIGPVMTPLPPSMQSWGGNKTKSGD